MEEWTTVIVAPAQEVAESADYVEPWPGDRVSQVIVGPDPRRQLEGKRRERVAVRDPEAFDPDVLRDIRNIAVGNACLIKGAIPTAVFAVSTKASA